MDLLTVKDGFAKELYRVGVADTANGISETLFHPTHHGQANLSALAGWYRDLNPVDRAFADQLMREAAISSVFGIAVMLDGGSGPLDIEGMDATPVLSISFTADEEEANEDPSAIHICPTVRGEELHDLFLDVVDANTPT